MPTVLHLRSSGGMFGAERVIAELGAHSSRFGYKSIIAALKDKDDPYPELLDLAGRQGLQTYCFEGSGPADSAYTRALKDFVLRENVDILHCHGYKENFFGALLSRQCRTVATNHLWKYHNARARVYCLIDAIQMRFFDAIVGVSHDILEEMARFGLKGAQVIHNGVDVETYVPREKDLDLLTQYGLDSSHVVIGMVSSLTPEKAHENALKALHQVLDSDPRLRLLIIGDGPLREDLQTQVKQLNLENRVIFAGIQSTIVEHMSIIDVYMLPSLREGMPMALLEAMACGKVVVASRVGEIPYVMDDQKTGILVDPGSSTQIAEAITALAASPETRSRVGAQAREKVVQDFSSLRMTESYVRLYEKVLSKGSRSEK